MGGMQLCSAYSLKYLVEGNTYIFEVNFQYAYKKIKINKFLKKPKFQNSTGKHHQHPKLKDMLERSVFSVHMPNWSLIWWSSTHLSVTIGGFIRWSGVHHPSLQRESLRVGARAVRRHPGGKQQLLLSLRSWVLPVPPCFWSDPSPALRLAATSRHRRSFCSWEQERQNQCLGCSPTS